MRQVEDMFDELKSQYVKKFHSLSLENKNLRLDIERIDASYCHQLAKIRSANNDVQELLASQIQRVEDERDEMNKTYTQNLIEEQTKNFKLQHEVADLKQNIEKTKQCLLKWNRQLESKPTSNHNLLSNSNQIENDLKLEQNKNIKLKDEIVDMKIKIVEIDNTLSELEHYLPEIITTIWDLKATNENQLLKSCKTIRLQNDLKEEKMKNVILIENITCLKKEIQVKNGTKNQINNEKIHEKLIYLKKKNAEIKCELNRLKNRLYL